MAVFSWSRRKAATNLAKHKVAFQDVTLAFSDPDMITQIDESSTDREERWRALASVEGVILFIVYTCLDEDCDEIRLISARRATSRERRIYVDGG